MDRRTFLMSAGAALAPAGARFENPFFALCMDTHDEKKRNLAGQAQMLKELGYDGAGHLWFENVAERLATLDRAGLRLFQVYMRVDAGPQAKQAYDAKLSEVLPLLRGRDVQLAVLMVGGKPSDPSLDERAVGLIREIADAARPQGVRLVLYPHQKHWLETVQDAIRVARKADRVNVGVMFNLCHWLKVGDERELRPLLEAAGPLLWALSINGSDRGPEIKAGTGNWIQPLDRGTFAILGFLQELHRTGYRGSIGLQCYGIPGDAAVHLARSMAAWRRLKDRINGRG
ncbi:MAG: TIM barrel protein [Acidobacteriota bacterium]